VFGALAYAQSNVQSVFDDIGTIGFLIFVGVLASPARLQTAENTRLDERPELRPDVADGHVRPPGLAVGSHLSSSGSTHDLALFRPLDRARTVSPIVNPALRLMRKCSGKRILSLKI